MLITLAVVNALSVQAPVNGATLRTWHMAEPMSAITPLVPGQAPNAWSLLETLDVVQLPSRQTQVYTLIDGTFVVGTPGEYCFELVSDDGSQLWVTGTKVVDNDGLHGPEAKTGCKTLDAGTHAFQVKWFQQGGGAACQVRWKTPDSDAFTTIPTGAMTTDWPKQRPVDEAEKLAVGAPSHNRAGDGRPVSGSFPGWSCHPVMVSYDAPVVALAPMGHGARGHAGGQRVRGRSRCGHCSALRRGPAGAGGHAGARRRRRAPRARRRGHHVAGHDR